MIVLSVNGLTKSFLSENILENVTFSISDRDKVGIVGDNGSGKTTLFNLLIKDLSADSGDINFAKNINLSMKSLRLICTHQTMKILTSCLM